ncbi:RNA-directed DNA polymerase, eukaryota [Tanacetum coccineum]
MALPRSKELCIGFYSCYDLDRWLEIFVLFEIGSVFQLHAKAKRLSTTLIASVAHSIFLTALVLMILAKEGFEHVKLSYLGGLWVLIELDNEGSKQKFLDHVGVNSWFCTLLNAIKILFSGERLFGWKLKEVHDSSNGESVSSFSHKVHNGGSILDILDDMVRVGHSMGLGHKTKKEWVKELNCKHRINFLALQETKMDCISHMDVKSLWGNSNFDFVASDSLGILVTETGNVSNDILLNRKGSKPTLQDIKLLEVEDLVTKITNKWAIEEIKNSNSFMIFKDSGFDFSFLRIFPPLVCSRELDKEIVLANKRASSVSASFRRDVRDGAERQQWDDLSSIMNSVVLSSSKDRWTCDLSGDGEFKVKVIRNFIDDLFLPSSDVATRWVKFIPIKVNVFSWRARRDRLPTRVNLSRRGVLLDSHLCPLCNAAMEDVQHVFFRCDVARVVLRKICRWWDLDWQEICSFSDWDAWFLSFRLSSRLKSILEGVFYVAWWRIWRLRNQLVFDASPPNRSTIFDDIVELADILMETKPKVIYVQIGRYYHKAECAKSSSSTKAGDLLAQNSERRPMKVQYVLFLSIHLFDYLFFDSLETVSASLETVITRSSHGLATPKYERNTSRLGIDGSMSLRSPSVGEGSNHPCSVSILLTSSFVGMLFFQSCVAWKPVLKKIGLWKSVRCLFVVNYKRALYYNLHYKRALYYNWHYADAMYNLEVAYGEMLKFEMKYLESSVIVFYELAFHFNPHCTEAFNNLGVIYKDTDNLDKAVECYQKLALSIKPNFSQLLNNLVVVYTVSWIPILNYFVLSCAANLSKLIVICKDKDEAENNNLSLKELQNVEQQVETALKRIQTQKVGKMDHCYDKNIDQRNAGFLLPPPQPQLPPPQTPRSLAPLLIGRSQGKSKGHFLAKLAMDDVDDEHEDVLDPHPDQIYTWLKASFIRRLTN